MGCAGGSAEEDEEALWAAAMEARESMGGCGEGEWRGGEDEGDMEGEAAAADDAGAASAARDDEEEAAPAGGTDRARFAASLELEDALDAATAGAPAAVVAAGADDESSSALRLDPVAAAAAG